MLWKKHWSGKRALVGSATWQLFQPALSGKEGCFRGGVKKIACNLLYSSMEYLTSNETTTNDRGTPLRGSGSAVTTWKNVVE